MVNKVKTFHESYAAICQVLLEEWDPIGVNGIKEAEDEYEAYASNLLYLAKKSKLDAAFIESYLKKVEDEMIGIAADPNSRAKAASNITKILCKLITPKPFEH